MDGEGQLARAERIGVAGADEAVAETARAHLRAARAAVERRHGPWARVTGAAADRVFSNLHRAEAQLLRLAPEPDLRWRGAVVLAQARRHLDASDPRLRMLEERLAGAGQVL
ncbi:hypothetical protein RM780_27735, partial [Streptomyces sp. DSM 44917]|nr:hypothetical protein [Streptomyces sp. DSM 44917]